jgi:hypothetical protein
MTTLLARSDGRDAARTRIAWRNLAMDPGVAGHSKSNIRHRGYRCKNTVKTVNSSPAFLRSGIDTTILWVGGYSHSRYMNAQTLYVSQGLGMVHGLRCRAPTLLSSRRARASRQDDAVRREVRIPSDNLACIQSKEIVISSHLFLDGTGTSVRMLALDVSSAANQEAIL